MLLRQMFEGQLEVDPVVARDRCERLGNQCPVATAPPPGPAARTNAETACGGSSASIPVADVYGSGSSGSPWIRVSAGIGTVPNMSISGPSSRSGDSPRRTAHQSASAMIGRANTMGSKTLRNTASRIARRESSSSPT